MECARMPYSTHELLADPNLIQPRFVWIPMQLKALGSLLFLALAIPAVPHPQEADARRRPDYFADLGRLRFESKLMIEGKSTSDAPSLKALSDEMLESFKDTELKGTLPGKVVCSINAFRSSSTSDVIYALEVSLVRPVSILGTTEVIEADVFSLHSVGRINAGEAKQYILKNASDLADQLATMVEDR